MLGTLLTQLVVADTVNKGHIEASAGADSREMGMGGILQGREGRVLLETLGKVLGGIRIELVAAETANKSRLEASGGADTRVSYVAADRSREEQACGWRRTPMS